MAVKTGVTTRKHNERAVRLVIESAKGAVIRKTNRALKTALAAAVERTPKWSGEATEAWTISFDSLPSRDTWKVTDAGTPKFAGGMWDKSAGPLNRAVVARETSLARPEVSARVKSGKAFRVYVTNTAPYSGIWLDGDTATAFDLLREVNHDFYTYKDIRAVMKARTKGIY